MNELESWFRQRRYLHFDRPLAQEKASKIVTSPKKVASHSFYPFLRYEVATQKIYKDQGKVEYKNKVRPISFSSHIYSYYAEVLSRLYEEQIKNSDLNQSILAFRKLGKNNIDFALDAFNDISLRGECTAIAFDISGFFDNLDHEILKRLWCSLCSFNRLPRDHFAVYKSITKFSIVDRKLLYNYLGYSLNNPPLNLTRICSPKEFRNQVRNAGLISKNESSKGIPQGSPISAILSNIYMLDFDKNISEAIREQGGSYYRYCDDMLFIVSIEWQNYIADLVRREIKKLKIDINVDKTEIRNFTLKKGELQSDKPLQYLGFMFDRKQITLRSAGFARYSKKMSKAVRLAKKMQIKQNRIRILKHQKPEKLYKKKLYSSYSHLGKQNFIHYGLRAAKKMHSKAIYHQLKPLWKSLHKELKK